MAEEGNLEGDEGQKDNKSKDEQFIPKVRFDEAQNKLKSQLQDEHDARVRLEEQVKQLQQGQNKQTVKEYSRSELRKLVEDEQITQEQADDIYDRQLERKFEQRLDSRLNEHTKSMSSQAFIENQLQEYRNLIPNLMVKGSEERDKAASEYQYLISTGSKDSVATELAAVRSAFGPIEKLKAQGFRDVQHHQETGGAGSPREKPKGLQANLSARERNYYQKQIDNGMYKDWDAVEKLLKSHGNNTVRRNMGANV